ncbi:MAG: hypothetical protein FWG36_02525 [Oscillospiraceae bacterium]|nr:hypothetical protein [Oscillospiraceae bacterium]
MIAIFASAKKKMGVKVAAYVRQKVNVSGVGVVSFMTAPRGKNWFIAVYALIFHVKNLENGLHLKTLNVLIILKN